MKVILYSVFSQIWLAHLRTQAKKKSYAMKWVITTLLFLVGFFENSRATNFMLLAYKDDIKDINIERANTFYRDSSKEIRFYLHVRCKKKEHCEGSVVKQELIPNEIGLLQSSFYDPKHPTKIIIHGFLDNSNKPMEQTIKNKLLEQEDLNVILVDWGKIAIGINYNAIAKRTPDVGAYTGELINFLIQNGAKADDFHLIGHSLGAHIAGFAGAAVKLGKVARITGLDPAKPGFHNVPIEKRLNTNCAKFIDCIHTCGGMLGLTEAICTVDFYPNGGKNMQPGCPFFDFGRCSHLRSYEYFAESINPNHKFLTESCPSLPVNSHSKCVPSTVEMGYYTSTKNKGIFYGKTNNRSPYATVTRRK